MNLLWKYINNLRHLYIYLCVLCVYNFDNMIKSCVSVDIWMVLSFGSFNKCERIKSNIFFFFCINHVNENHFHKLRACIHFSIAINLTMGSNCFRLFLLFFVEWNRRKQITKQISLVFIYLKYFFFLYLPRF